METNIKARSYFRKITWGELDPLGIVFYPRYYEWIDGCAHRFFEDLGIPMERMVRERGIIFALSETSCRYFHPARYHEEVEILTSLKELDKRTILLDYQIRRRDDQSILSHCQERRICVEFQGHHGIKSIEIPPDIFEILQAVLPEGP
jgi:YbgC/YbaW family acyl-CoA thioester hydrolase